MQFIVISEQLRCTLYACFLGIGYGFLYSLVKILRLLWSDEDTIHIPIVSKFRKVKKIKFIRYLYEFVFIHVLDIVYFLLSSVIFCIFVFYLNHGRVRWYLIFAVIIGFYIWYISLGKLLVYVSKYIVCLIKAFTNLLLCVIIYPVKLLLWPIRISLRYLIISIKTDIEIKKIHRTVMFKGRRSI